MKHKSIVWGTVLFGFLASSAIGQYGNREKNICKTTHLGPMAISVVCLNNADPTGTKIGNTLIISCADSRTGK